jgi:hypothetical protein
MVIDSDDEDAHERLCALPSIRQLLLLDSYVEMHVPFQTSCRVPFPCVDSEISSAALRGSATWISPVSAWTSRRER